MGDPRCHVRGLLAPTPSTLDDEPQLRGRQWRTSRSPSSFHVAQCLARETARANRHGGVAARLGGSRCIESRRRRALPIHGSLRFSAHVWSKNSSSTSMVVAEQPTEPLTALDRAVTNGVLVRRGEEDDVALLPLPLMRSLDVIVLAEGCEGSSKCLLAEQDQPVEALGLDGAHPALGVGINVRAPGGDLQLEQTFNLSDWVSLGSAVAATDGTLARFGRDQGPFGLLRINATGITAGTAEAVTVTIVGRLG